MGIPMTGPEAERNALSRELFIARQNAHDKGVYIDELEYRSHHWFKKFRQMEDEHNDILNKRDHSQMTWKDLALTVGVAAFCWLLWVVLGRLGLLV